MLRELVPLKAVKDKCPKSMILLDQLLMEEEGIRQINMIAFLLQE